MRILAGIARGVKAVLEKRIYSESVAEEKMGGAGAK